MPEERLPTDSRLIHLDPLSLCLQNAKAMRQGPGGSPRPGGR